MSLGQCSYFSFVVFKNHNNEQDQIFFAFGDNANGQQGYNSDDNRLPAVCTTLNHLFKDIRVTQITTGVDHSLFLLENGSVYSCGLNGSGQCGRSMNGQQLQVEPGIVPGLCGITKIASGSSHNLCIDADGSVWVFGNNMSGQLGFPPAPSLGDDYDDDDTDDDDSVNLDKATMNSYFVDMNVVEIDCGIDHSLCITKDGKAFTFGGNLSGECGNNTNYGNVHTPFCIQAMEECKDVLFEGGSCGSSHTMLLACYPCNDVYAFGGNNDNETGIINSESYQLRPQLVKKSEIGVEKMQKL